MKALKEKAFAYCTYPVTMTDSSGRIGNTWAPKDELPCQWLYRNNHEWYFERIRKDSTNPGWMIMTPKDGSGDPRSPINQQQNFEGLFFSASLWNGQLPNISPYGSKRLLMSAQSMLINKNMYFADFYCTAGGSSGNHYLILVITTPGLGPDMFCQNKLVQLDFHNNPFLYYENDQLYANQTQKLWIEIFYTEDIKVFEGDLPAAGVQFDQVVHQSRVSQSIVMKDRTCRCCNIDFNPVFSSPQ
jgi:Phytanoyl-CoA hydroxylase-interacting protein C-terminus